MLGIEGVEDPEAEMVLELVIWGVAAVRLAAEEVTVVWLHRFVFFVLVAAPGAALFSKPYCYQYVEDL